MPPGFSVMIKRQAVGFQIEFRFGKIFTHQNLDDGKLESDMKLETKEMLNEIIFEDMIKKIRNHPQYRKQK